MTTEPPTPAPAPTPEPQAIGPEPQFIASEPPTMPSPQAAPAPAVEWGSLHPMSQPELADQQSSRTLALVALILCLIPFPVTIIAGVVMAIVVLARGRRRAGRGFGMAFGALGAAAVWTVVGISLVVVLGMANAPAERANGTTGELVDSGSMNPILLQVTDCLDVPEEGDVVSVKAKPCSEEHDGEVYSSPHLTDGAFPGEDAVLAEAEKLCVEEFPGYVGVDFEDSSLEMFYLYPLNEAQWDSAPWVTCVVQSPEPLTGTMRLAKR